jgi:uncharacterized integral membrane protein
MRIEMATRRVPVKDNKKRKRKRHLRWDKIIAIILFIVIIVFAYIIYNDISKGLLAIN